MARFEITGPDGSKYEISAPDNATEKEIMAFAQKQFAQQPKEAQQAPYDATEGMSGVKKFLAGAGKAYADTGRGVGQLLRQGLEYGNGKGIADKLGLPTQADIDEAKLRDEALTKTGAGKAGQFIGDVALMAPSVLIPGAATVRGGALLGAASGAIRPVATGESRALNTGIGGVAGAALPATLKALQVGKAALVDPFTEAGKQKVIGGALNRAASNPEQAIVKMRATRGATPGFEPTAGQAANDAGIASVERAARAIDPGGFGDVEASQRAALVNALRGVAGTPEARAGAVEARDEAAQSLYGQAFRSDKMRQQLAQEAAQMRSPFAGVGLSAGKENLSTPGLQELSKRPIFQEAVQQAKALAANKGVRLDDPLQSLEGLHYIKLALDDMGNPGAASAMGRNANAAVADVKRNLTRELQNISPLYGNARQTFADMSKPINQMDVGKELYERFVPALAESEVPFKSKADSLAQALRNGDELAKNVTGMKGAKLNEIMTPEQMSALQGVVSDSQMKAAAQAAGKEGGSDTVQKMAMSHLLSESGIPNWIQGVGRVPGGWLRTAGDILYTKNDQALRNKMADILKNPEATAAAMELAAKPTSTAYRILKGTGNMPFLTAPNTLPALMNGLEQ